MEKLAFLFPGQGCQNIGMGKQLIQTYSEAKRTFDEASSALGIDMERLCINGNLSEINELENMFTAIVTVSVASFRAYMERFGLPPAILAGHSLGEYSALVCSGVINFSDALKLVHFRALLAKQASQELQSCMSVIDGIQKEKLLTLCQTLSDKELCAYVACFNHDQQFVITGHESAVMKVEDEVLQNGGQVTPIFMAPPLHSPLMTPYIGRFEAELSKLRLNHFEYPVVSNITAQIYNHPSDIPDLLVQQLISPVRWNESVDFMIKQGITSFVEMGPQAILTNLCKNKLDDRLYAFSSPTDQDKLETALALERKKRLGFLTRSLAIAVSTRNNNWNDDQYRSGVEAPYEGVVQAVNMLKENGGFPTQEHFKQALSMLQSVFNTKGIPLQEQEERFQQLMRETGIQVHLQQST